MSTNDLRNHAPLTNDSSNRASVTFTNVRIATDGEYRIVAGLKDKAGNPEAYSAALTIWIDRTAPAVPARAPTLNSADDTWANRNGATNQERVAQKTDGITSQQTGLTFFGCAAHSDIQGASGPTKHALVRAVINENDGGTKSLTVDATGNNTAKADATGANAFEDTIQETTTRVRLNSGADACASGELAYNDLDVDESLGTVNEEEIFEIQITAEDRAGNVSGASSTAKIIIDKKAPASFIGSFDLSMDTDNGDDQGDNATSEADLTFTNTRASRDENGFDATFSQGLAYTNAIDYHTLPQRTLSHYQTKYPVGNRYIELTTDIRSNTNHLRDNNRLPCNPNRQHRYRWY